MSEQRRIATILDAADAIRLKRRQVLSHLDFLAESIFHATFVDAHFPSEKLGELSTTSSGGTPNRTQSEFYGGGIPWVKSGELHAGLVTATEETLTLAGLQQSSAKILRPGTVLIAMYGATAGVVGQLGVAAATNQAVCAITPGDRILPAYLMAALRSKTKELQDRRSGGAQPNLSQGTLRGLQIAVPPIDLQEIFADKVSKITALRHAIEQASGEDEELFASLQSRAFTGAL